MAATEFQQMHKDVEITVTAGGSGAGRSQVCQGQVDIGNSDVPLSEQGKPTSTAAAQVETAVAIQAFGPVANKVGPGSVTSLTKEQLQGIFSGAHHQLVRGRRRRSGNRAGEPGQGFRYTQEHG
ncbi:MAG: substrate-binding domain-containing protein [Anaerolineales bacterium]|nr:substrate-binding domain-containing protein [Anaerolineales bacterium]